MYIPTWEIQNMFIRNTECDVILCSDNTKLLISKKSKHHPKKTYLKSPNFIRTKDRHRIT